VRRGLHFGLWHEILPLVSESFFPGPRTPAKYIDDSLRYPSLLLFDLGFFRAPRNISHSVIAIDVSFLNSSFHPLPPNQRTDGLFKCCLFSPSVAEATFFPHMEMFLSPARTLKATLHFPFVRVRLGGSIQLKFSVSPETGSTPPSLTIFFFKLCGEASPFTLQSLYRHPVPCSFFPLEKPRQHAMPHQLLPSVNSCLSCSLVPWTRSHVNLTSPPHPCVTRRWDSV